MLGSILLRRLLSYSVTASRWAASTSSANTWVQPSSATAAAYLHQPPGRSGSSAARCSAQMARTVAAAANA